MTFSIEYTKNTWCESRIRFITEKPDVSEKVDIRVYGKIMAFIMRLFRRTISLDASLFSNASGKCIYMNRKSFDEWLRVHNSEYQKENIENILKKIIESINHPSKKDEDELSDETSPKFPMDKFSPIKLDEKKISYTADKFSS